MHGKARPCISFWQFCGINSRLGVIKELPTRVRGREVSWDGYAGDNE
jgi:hypothetical protein